jgi:hypothetical protein
MCQASRPSVVNVLALAGRPIQLAIIPASATTAHAPMESQASVTITQASGLGQQSNASQTRQNISKARPKTKILF